MSEINQIKAEARQLLEEVNNPFEKTAGKCSAGSVYNEHNYEHSFKNRLGRLKQKVAALKTNSASLSSALAACYHVK